MESKKGIFYGIELDIKNGKYDGSFLGKTYFKCDKRKGLFITIKDIDKIIKKCKSMPRVTINSTIYSNKYGKGKVKYIGIPFTQKNKSQNVYYGIELEKHGKTNIFLKKDEFEWKKHQKQLTPGAPIKTKRKKVTKQHQTSSAIDKKSVCVKTKRKSKQKMPSRSLSKTYAPLTAEPNIFRKKKSQKVIKRKKKSKVFVSQIAHSVKKKVSKKCKSFKKNQSVKCKQSKQDTRGRNKDKKTEKSETKIRTKSATPTIHRCEQRKTLILRRTTSEKQCDSVIKNEKKCANDTINREEKGQNAFYDADETETEFTIYCVEEEKAMNAISNVMRLKNYRLFLSHIDKIKTCVNALSKESKKRILNHLFLQRHDNNLMIWQSILHLALFIVKSMHSFFSLAEKKQTWNFIDYLLQNGGNPLSKMSIRQGNEYEHKNVIRLMTEALSTYKQNELLIMQRFVWLWSLIENEICTDDYLQKPALLTYCENFNDRYVILAAGYEELPSPKILEKYFDFGCDLLHFCNDDAVYFDFNQIRRSMQPNLLITNVRINYNMRHHIDLIGRVVVYYQYYTSLRCQNLMALYAELIREEKYPQITEDVMSKIVSYTTTKIIFTDSKLQQINVVSGVLSKMCDYSEEWRHFLYDYVILKMTEKDKIKIKKLSKKWSNKSECDHWISNVKNRKKLLCFLDLFEYVIGYKTSQKMINYFVQKNDFEIIQQYVRNEHAFKYLELYNLLFEFDLDCNKCAKYIFQKLIDCALNINKKDNIKHSKSQSRKELNNLYVQFCRNDVNDLRFQKNLLFVLKQLLSNKKGYKFDFCQAILHCFKARQMNTLMWLMDNELLVDVERALRLFYVDDVMKRIIFGMDEFDEGQEDFLKLILNWTWQYAQKKEDMQTWYVKWLKDARMVEDEDCCKIFEFYCDLSNDNVV